MLPTVLTAALTAGLLLTGAPVSAEPAAEPTAAAEASTFTPRSPLRVLDTREGGGPVGAGGVHTLNLAGVVPTTTTAVVLNVTGVTPTAATHVSVYPSGTGPATVSNLNLAAGDIRANQVTVQLSADRKVDLYNNSGSIHLVVDLAGHYSTDAGAKFTALPPNRLVDTRDGHGPVAPNDVLSLDLTNRIPTSATAVTFNLTATGATAATFVTAWPAGPPRPNASTLNLPAGATRPNLVTVAVGANRTVNLYNLAGSVHLIADLAGFYTPEYGAHFLPANPTRLLDTRTGWGTLGPRATLELDLEQWSPSTVTGVVLNVTGVDATVPTYVSAWSVWDPQPLHGSILNPAPGQAVPNAAVVAYGQGTAINLYNQNGNVHLVVDLAGVFAVSYTDCQDNCVYSWGRNDHRRLGTAEVVTHGTYPAQVIGLSDVRAVAESRGNGYALRTDGTVWAWGLNSEGQLGNGWLSPSGGGSPVPVPVPGLTGVTAVTAAEGNGYALRADGTVWAWGSNTYGKLGIGPTLDDATTPVQVPGLTGVVAISARFLTTYALKADGTVWAWGDNVSGALGNGSTAAESPVPVQVSGLTDVTAIAARGWGGYALRADGTVWGWGQNRDGQLGDGQSCAPTGTCESRVPVHIPGLTDVTAIAGGPLNGYAIRDDGTAWGWGQNTYRQLGNGQVCELISGCLSREPVQVSGLTTVTAVASFEYGGYALLADGSVWSWGTGALANGEPSSTVPMQVGVGASAISGGFYSGLVVAP